MARLEVRLRNRLVDSRASFPACSRLRIQAKNPARMSAPDDDEHRHQRKIAVGCHDPPDQHDQAHGGQDRPDDVERAVGIGGQRDR